jgi:hypothetical protein
MLLETKRVLGEKPLNVFHFSFSFKRVVGLGVMLDTIPPITIYEKIFCFEVNLIWLRFYWIKYKS